MQEDTNMTGLRCTATTGGSTGLTAITLSAATEKCVFVMTAPANQRIKLKSIGYYFAGTVSTNTPVQVVLCRTTGAGSNSTSITPKRLCAGSETPQAVCAKDMGTPDWPTKSDILEIWNIHPQNGYKGLLPLTDEIEVPGGTYIALFMKAVQQVDVALTVGYEE
jgi:hypothetical protein